MSNWMPLGTQSPTQLSGARLQLHWAAQVVSALGKTFITPRPDDSHPNLGFLPERGLFLSHASETSPSLHAALDIASHELMILDTNHETIATQPLEGLTLSQAFDWLQTAVHKHSNGTDQLNRHLYDIPKHPVGDGAAFSEPNIPHLAELRSWYHDANVILQAFAHVTDGASDVRTWPHHFDIGLLVVLHDDGDPETSRSIGMGMTPGDGYYDEPYFYVNPYPRPSGNERPELAGGGAWHEHEWFGAVLTGRTLAAVPPDQQINTATAYLKSAFRASQELLQ